MSTSRKVQVLRIEDDFHRCPVCEYEDGFHVSFRRDQGNRVPIILICPECHSRFDVGWEISLPAES
ncbi:MAG: hypothetical protein ABH878_04195 [bacterium]